MEKYLWTAFELAVNLFQGFLFMYFTFGVLEYKSARINPKIPFIAGSLAYFATVTLFNYLTYFEGLAAFAYSLIVFIVAILFFKGSLLKKLVVSIIPTSCVVLATTCAFNIISLIFNQKIADMMSQSTVYRLAVVVLANSLFFLFLFVIKKLFQHHNIKLTGTEWIMTASMFSISIIIIALLFFVIFSGIGKINEIYIWISIMLIIAINITVYYLMVQLNKKHGLELEHTLLKQQYSFQMKSMQEVKKQYEILQKTRHDFNNSLRIIQALNDKCNTSGIDQYISEYLESQSKSIHLISTDNEYVNAIINSKLSQAESEKIKVKVSAISDISCVANIDLCNIIGNMFDNAIEACKKCDKNRIINFDISKDNEYIVIFMMNSIPGSVLKENPELDTDKKDKLRHGYGTKIIKELAEKHHGFADFYEQDGFFCCNVCLMLE